MHVEVRVGQVGQRIRMAASVASRYALGADGVGAAHPGARGSRVTASRYALGAEGGGAARPGAYMCSPRNCARCLLGGVGMSKTSCAARCSRGSVQGVLRAPAEGEGGVAHRENLAATASATLERSAGTVAHGKRAARERRRRRSKVSRRRRAGRAPPARRGRRVRVPRAFKRPAKTFGGWWVVVAATPNYRRLASPDRGKYFCSLIILRNHRGETMRSCALTKFVKSKSRPLTVHTTQRTKARKPHTTPVQ